jgi:hypothetical protein
VIDDPSTSSASSSPIQCNKTGRGGLHLEDHRRVSNKFGPGRRGRNGSRRGYTTQVTFQPGSHLRPHTSHTSGHTQVTPQASPQVTPQVTPRVTQNYTTSGHKPRVTHAKLHTLGHTKVHISYYTGHRDLGRLPRPSLAVAASMLLTTPHTATVTLWVLTSFPETAAYTNASSK